MSKKRSRGNGEGSIYRMQDGRWRAAVTIRTPNGKTKRQVFTKKTRHEVQDKLTKALRDMQLGLPIVSEKQTVAAFLAHWLNQVVKPNRRPKTWRTYSDLVKNHITPALGDVTLGKLSPQHVREFLNAKLAAPDPADADTNGETRSRKRIGPKTVKHILRTLRTALARAVKDGQVQRNVAALVDPPQVPHRETQAFSPEQARAFLAAAQGRRLEAVYTVAVAIGLRQGEILGLEWRDVDFETGMLTVRAALQRVDKKLVQVEPKSKKSRRIIQLPTVCISGLARHKAQQEQERSISGTSWRDTGYIFTNRNGGPIDARNLIRDYHAFTRTKKTKKKSTITIDDAAGDQVTPSPKPVRRLPDRAIARQQVRKFPSIRFHDLRHSTATMLLAQGVSPRYIAELLGHSQVSFTMQIYAHVLPEVQRDTANKMDETLAPRPVATSVATKPIQGFVS